VRPFTTIAQFQYIIVRRRAYDPVKDFVWPSTEVTERYTGIVERALERFTR
jgi:ribosome-binding ATPase YchF (GTP1/OBG family)